MAKLDWQKTLPSVEELLTSPDYFAIEKATPTQRAACRVLEGRPLGDLWKYKRVRDAFRGVKPPEEAPFEFIWLAAIRGAKSILASAMAFRWAMTVDLTGCVVSDEIRIPMVSVDKDKAAQTFNHLAATMQARPKFSQYLMKDPTDGSILLRRPDGFVVEILVTAGRRAGSSLVARWLAGCIFDECARMQGADDAIVNIETSRQAILGRIRPGGGIMYPSSPFQPDGPIYQWVEEKWGKPSADLVVMRAPGKSVNPEYWTDERAEQLKRRDFIAYKTDCLAEFADSEYSVFSAEDIDACSRASDAPIARQPLHNYTATMDPATRSNAWTLTVWTCVEGPPKPEYSVVLAKQWVPRGEKLSPAKVLTEIADDVAEYGLDTVYTDQWSVDALADLAAQIPPLPDGAPRALQLVDETTTGMERYEGIKTLQLLIEERRLSLPRDPIVKQDLVRVKRRVTADGIKFVLPRPSGGQGRHADYVPSLSLATFFLPPEPLPAPTIFQDPMLQRELDRIAERQSRDVTEAAVYRMNGIR